MIYTKNTIPTDLSENSISPFVDYNKLKSDMVWLTFEQDITVEDGINYTFAPNSVELSGKVVIDTVVNQIDEIYGTVTLDEGFDIGISYFINNSENSNDKSINTRTHVNVFSLAQKYIENSSYVLCFDLTDRIGTDEYPNSPFTQTLSVLSVDTDEIKTYAVTLDKFTAEDNYEVKLTIKRV
jgi:hypothetical protein